MKFSVTVTLKKDVLDPQGKVVQNTLQNLGMDSLKSVRQGKYFELEVSDNDQAKAEKREVILADEISPDTCRLWDVKSERKLDKDRFRKDLGNVIQAYQEVARRLGIMPETTNISEVNFKKPTSINIKKK